MHITWNDYCSKFNELLSPHIDTKLNRKKKIFPYVKNSGFTCLFFFSNCELLFCIAAAAATAAKLRQSCPTLCDPMDSSPPGSPVPGILQARTLEWVAISFSNALKWKVKVKSSVVSNSSWPYCPHPTRLLCPWDFSGKSTGVGCHCLLRFCIGV